MPRHITALAGSGTPRWKAPCPDRRRCPLPADPAPCRHCASTRRCALQDWLSHAVQEVADDVADQTVALRVVHDVPNQGCGWDRGHRCPVGPAGAVTTAGAAMAYRVRGREQAPDDDRRDAGRALPGQVGSRAPRLLMVRCAGRSALLKCTSSCSGHAGMTPVTVANFGQNLNFKPPALVRDSGSDSRDAEAPSAVRSWLPVAGQLPGPLVAR